MDKNRAFWLLLTHIPHFHCQVKDYCVASGPTKQLVFILKSDAKETGGLGLGREGGIDTEGASKPG